MYGIIQGVVWILDSQLLENLAVGRATTTDTSYKANVKHNYAMFKGRHVSPALLKSGRLKVREE